MPEKKQIIDVLIKDSIEWKNRYHILLDAIKDLIDVSDENVDTLDLFSIWEQFMIWQ